MPEMEKLSRTHTEQRGAKVPTGKGRVVELRETCLVKCWGISWVHLGSANVPWITTLPARKPFWQNVRRPKSSSVETTAPKHFMLNFRRSRTPLVRYVAKDLRGMGVGVGADTNCGRQGGDIGLNFTWN